VVTFTGKPTIAKQHKSFGGATIDYRTIYEYDDMERLTKIDKAPWRGTNDVDKN